MSYHLLSIEGYQNAGDTNYIKQLYEERFNGDATIQTRVYPNLMKRSERAGAGYPAFVVNIREVQMLIETVGRNSARIINCARQLPAIAHRQYLNRLLLSEIQDTNSIEGIATTLDEIGTTVTQLLSVEKNEARLSSTVKQYLDVLQGEELRLESLDDIRAVYDHLLAGEIPADKRPDGKRFRAGFVRIGDNNQTVHLPADREEEIENQLTSWLSLVNQNDFNFLIKAFLAHFLFENIHPFYDGNGRTGRYILASYLARRLDMFSGISISSAISSARQRYYRSFRESADVKNYAELTLFVRDMLAILADFQLDILANMVAKIEDLERVKQNIVALTEADSLEFRILYLIAQSDLFNDVPSVQIKDSEVIEELKRQDLEEQPHRQPIGVAAAKAAIKRLTENRLLTVPQPRPTRKRQHNLNEVLLK